MRTFARWTLALLSIALVVIGLAAAYLLTGGRYETFPKSALVTAADRRIAPEWTRPCRPSAPAYGSSVECARVRGRLVHVESVDPDGDGDLHLVLLDGLKPRIVKMTAANRVTDVPRLGSAVSATGWSLTGASGRAEVDAVRLR